VVADQGGKMGMRVKLSDLVEAMEIRPQESSFFLNKETGEVVMVSEEEFGAAEEGENLEEYPDWQQEAIIVARDILDHKEKYVELPSEFEIDEYGMMVDFCRSLEDPQISEALSQAIKGKGAFRRFKDHIIELGIEDRWYKYRDEAFKKMAIEWCEDNNIDYIDQPKR